MALSYKEMEAFPPATSWCAGHPAARTARSSAPRGLDAVQGCHRPRTADVNPFGDSVVVGARHHEQSDRKRIVAALDPYRPPTRHDTGFLGEQVTTAARQRAQLGDGLADRPAGTREPDRVPDSRANRIRSVSGFRRPEGIPPVSNRCSVNARGPTRLAPKQTTPERVASSGALDLQTSGRISPLHRDENSVRLLRRFVFAQVRTRAGAGTRTRNRPITRWVPSASSGPYQRLRLHCRPQRVPESARVDSISRHEPCHAPRHSEHGQCSGSATCPAAHR